jgi:hypothetical protein
MTSSHHPGQIGCPASADTCRLERPPARPDNVLGWMS